MNHDIATDFETIKNTLEQLKDSVEKAITDNAALIDCFFYAQTLDNQKTHFKEIFNLDQNPEYYDEVRKLEDEANEIYQKLYRVYDRLSAEEMIDLIRGDLEKLTKDYIDKMSYIGEVDKEKLIEILELRDKIKILFDELVLWKNRFTRDERFELERSEPLYQSIQESDQRLKDEMVVNAESHEQVRAKAEAKLIKRPDGSKRFNFWWWYAGV